MNKSLSYPSSMDLARLDTPLVSLGRLSRKVGIEILCKRDDMTGAALSGNLLDMLRRVQLVGSTSSRQGSLAAPELLVEALDLAG